jgi:hypothetical protein
MNIPFDGLENYLIFAWSKTMWFKALDWPWTKTHATFFLIKGTGLTVDENSYAPNRSTPRSLRRTIRFVYIVHFRWFIQSELKLDEAIFCNPPWIIIFFMSGLFKLYSFSDSVEVSSDLCHMPVGITSNTYCIRN